MFKPAWLSSQSTPMASTLLIRSQHSQRQILYDPQRQKDLTATLHKPSNTNKIIKLHRSHQRFQNDSHGKGGFTIQGRWQQAATSAGQRERQRANKQTFSRGAEKQRCRTRRGTEGGGCLRAPLPSPRRPLGWAGPPRGAEGGWASPPRGVGAGSDLLTPPG